ncbi:MAG: acyl-CoA dehydrogenase family protein, partial [FCB group bacterium]|nr:acyl-CoA dehydrogenase family protein [FCB group bacterium]
MDFSIPSETQDLLDRIRRFIEDEVFPVESEFLINGFEAIQADAGRLRERARQLGFWLPQIPAEEGGLGLGLVGHGLVSAELGRSPLGHYVCNAQAPDAGNMEILLKYGTPAQKERYLYPLLNGDIRSCFAMTEPEHAGSNPVWMSTTAVRDGDDYVINGHKWFSTGGDGSAFAVTMAVTDPGAPPHARASMFLVPTDTPGFSIECNTPVMGHRGSNWDSHAEVRFEDCRVPEENLLGALGEGFAIAQERLGPGRIHHCMRWTGVCERSFDLMCDYALHRELAPGDTLSTREFVQGWIAESRAEIDAARLMVLRTAWTIERDGPKAAREEISLIKFFVANVMMRDIDRAIQTHGGHGVTDYTPLSNYWRNQRARPNYER